MVFEQPIDEETKPAEELDKIAHITSLLRQEAEKYLRILETHTARLQTLNEVFAETPEANIAEKIESCVAQMSIDMLRYSAKMEEYVLALENSVDSYIESESARFSNQLRNIETVEEKNAWICWRNAATMFLETLNSAQAATRDHRDVIVSFKGINRNMDDASGRLIEILDHYIRVTNKLKGFYAKALVLIDKELGNRFEPGNSTGS